MDDDSYLAALLSGLRKELQRIDRQIVSFEAAHSIRQVRRRSSGRTTHRQLGAVSKGRMAPIAPARWASTEGRDTTNVGGADAP